MNKIYSYIISFILYIITCATVSAHIEIIENSVNGFHLLYSAGEAVIDTMYSDENTYVSFSYNGHISDTAPGSPSIPTESVYFLAPSGETPSVILNSESTTTISSYRLQPKPELTADPQGNAVYNFTENAEQYARSGWQPSSHVTLEPTVTDGALTTWKLTISPLRFDAYRTVIETLENTTIQVSFSDNFDNLQYNQRIPSYAINESIVRDYFAASGIPKISQTSESPFNTGQWYKIKLTESGMYRISGTELSKAGFPIGSISSDAIHVMYGGGLMLDEAPSPPSIGSFKEISIMVNDEGDGVFNSSDSILFYGESLTRFHLDSGDSLPQHVNYLYADTGENVYWIYIDDELTPKRIVSQSGKPTQGITPTTTFRETIHLEPENYIEIGDSWGAESGLEWFWEAITNKTKTFSFSVPGYIPDTEAHMRLGFRKGMANTESSTQYYLNHNVEYSVNGAYFQFLSFRSDYYSTSVHEITIPLLSTGLNTLELSRNDSENINNVRFDWLEIEYNRELSFSGNLSFFSYDIDNQIVYQVSNVTNSLVDVYDITDPFNCMKITDTEYSSQENTLTFQIDTSADECSKYHIVSSNFYKKADSITKKEQSNLRSPMNNADYIIITHNDFYDSAVTLANWRAHDSTIEPLKTMVVDIDDIYDEFSWGVYDPVAIRDFLYYAWHNYNQGVKPVTYCCLFGDTTYRYKNIDNQVEINYVPSYTAFRNLNGIITDDFFVWFDNNAIPEIALGRMCVTNAENATDIVEKTIAYERDATPDAWHNKILFVADDEYVFSGNVDSSNKFTLDIEKLDKESNIPSSFERKKILLIEYPMVNREKPAVTTDLFNTINDGCLFFNFVGHGNNDVLAHENILRGSRDIDKFTNGNRLPVFLAFSCTVGKFDKPGIASLSESMHLRNNGGCIAAISAARTTYNSENMDLNKQFYINLFDAVNNPERRLGAALTAAKKALASPSARNPIKYFLFGDPATRLIMPKSSITASLPDTLRRLEENNISGMINMTGQPDETITLNVVAQGPKQHIVYKNPLRDNLTFSYTKPGNTFFRGDITLQGPEFDFPVIVPKDIESDLAYDDEIQQESKVIFYAYGQSVEASGAIDNFYIGDINSEAPADTEGPEMTLSFDNKNFESGDIIRRQTELTVGFSDPSGINITGTRGHNITLIIDRSESYVITDNYISKTGYDTGELIFPVPLLSVGKHDFEISAYDSYNNTSKVAVTATVAGSETGDIAIQNLLNYPNPMAYDGTTFTFNLTDFAQHATIRVYSQSGRLVDTVSFMANYGFNKVYWKPPVVLANGVYFYKLSVTSSNGRTSSKIEKLVMMR